MSIKIKNRQSNEVKYLHGWTTKNELEYLDELIAGYHYRGKGIEHNPKKLLRNYIRSAKRRKRWGTWGTVDADICIDKAERELKWQ